MGLDIYVYKFPSSKEENLLWKNENDSDDNRFILKTEIDRKKFEKISIDEIVEYFDYEKVFSSLNLIFKDYTWLMCNGRICVFQMDESLDAYDEAIKKVETESTHFIYENFVIIKLDQCPDKKINEKVIYTKQIGYQRKGANKLFYLKNKWNEGELITDKQKLYHYWNKYFSGEKYIEKKLRNNDDWGYSVEYNSSAKENRKRFKKNIIDKFIEGQTFVYFG